MAVTTLDQLRKYSEGSEVELPGFYGKESGSEDLYGNYKITESLYGC